MSKLSGKAQITLKVIKGMSADDLDDFLTDDSSDKKAASYALEHYDKIIKQIARRAERAKKQTLKKALAKKGKKL